MFSDSWRITQCYHVQGMKRCEFSASHMKLEVLLSIIYHSLIIFSIPCKPFCPFRSQCSHFCMVCNCTLWKKASYLKPTVHVTTEQWNNSCNYTILLFLLQERVVPSSPSTKTMNYDHGLHVLRDSNVFTKRVGALRNIVTCRAWSIVNLVHPF